MPGQPDPAAARLAPLPTPPAPPARPVMTTIDPGGGHAAPAAEPPAKLLIVGPDINLSGEITACDRLVVEGSVQVTLNRTRAIEIAETGRFTNGKAEVDEAEIAGVYEGSLTVRKRLLIRATGRVSGNVRYGEIEIERGGRLAGSIERLPEEPLRAVTTPPSQPTRRQRRRSSCRPEQFLGCRHGQAAALRQVEEDRGQAALLDQRRRLLGRHPDRLALALLGPVVVPALDLEAGTRRPGPGSTGRRAAACRSGSCPGARRRSHLPGRLPRTPRAPPAHAALTPRSAQPLGSTQRLVSREVISRTSNRPSRPVHHGRAAYC